MAKEPDQPMSQLIATSVEAVFRNHRVIMLVLDAETGSVIDANHAAENFYGYPLQTLKTKTMADIRLGPAPCPPIFGNQNEPIADESQVWTHRLANGELRQMEEHISAFSVGERGCLFSVFLDVTSRWELEKQHWQHEEAARQKVEEALRLSEEKFAKVFKISPDSININRFSDGKYVDINDGFTAMTGYTREDVLGHSSLPGDLGIWVNREDRERMTSQLREFGVVIGLEASFRRKDASVIIGSMSARILEINGETCVLTVTRDLTQRIQQEEALRERERNYREIFNFTSDALLILDEFGNIVDANERACTFFEIDYATALTLTVSGLVNGPAPFSRVEAEAYLRRVLTEGPQVFDWRTLKKSGEVAWAEVVLKACDINSQKRVITSLRDITERKKNEDIRKTYAGYQQALLDNFPFLVWLKDQESRFLAVNKPFAQACGQGTPEAVVGKTDLDVWPRELAESYRADDRAVLESGHPKNVEEMIAQNNQAGVWFETYKSPVQVNDRMVGTVGFSRDITQRKLAETTLAAERERLLVTLKSIGDGVIATDTQGKVVIMNKVAEVLTGWPQAEAQGRPLVEIFRIVHEGSKEPFDSPVDKVLRSKISVELANHTLLISRQGLEYVIGDSGAPIFDKQGEIIGVVLVFRDMNEKQRLIEAAQRTQKLESLSVLAGGIAHDFNNLLGGIFGCLELAKNSSRDSKVSEYLDSALGAMDRARALTHQLLTFAKGGAPVRKVWPLGAFLRETATFALSGSKATFRLELSDDLWMVEFDKNQLGQVVDNVLINAQQAMPSGGQVRIAAGNITLENREHVSLPPGEYVRITFTDQGGGIPREILPRIFDPFFTTKLKGSGLGLATCYSIMSQHHGGIDVKSEVGQGSTFYLYLPAHRGTAALGGEVTRDTRRREGRILFMDDEELIREIVSEMLGRLGYTCVCTANGVEAMQRFNQAEQESRPFSAVILDLTVPGNMGGKEAATMIHRRKPNLPLIVSSGYAEDPVVAQPKEYGFSASLCKPYVMSELAKILDALLT